MLGRLDPDALRRLRAWARESRQHDLPTALRLGADITAAMLRKPAVQRRWNAFAEGDGAVVRVTITDGIARVTLADPRSANALGEDDGRTHSRMRSATIDRTADVRVVVLSGEGDTFSCGAPRELLLRLAAGELRPTDILLPRLLLDCAVPVVAAMAGHATGGGFALGLAADIVLIADESRYGFTFMNMGFTPGMGATRLCEHVLSTGGRSRTALHR